MANAKGLKGRLQSIKNTKKTTKAMELVAGAKMRRAVSTAVESRTYQQYLRDLMQRLESNVNVEETPELAPFFASTAKTPEHGKTTIVVYTSNRGLCGAFNSNVIKQVVQYVKEVGAENVEVIGIGKKGVAMLNAFNIKAELAYEKNDSATDETEVQEVAQYAFKQFTDGASDRVMVAYTDFESPLKQTAKIVQIYPIQGAPISDGVENAADVDMTDATLPPTDVEYIYEPSAARVLHHLVPRLGTLQLYQALLESNASEHSSRMLAMKNATEAATEMGEDLSMQYNRARQASITQEIAEISAGSAAVS